MKHFACAALLLAGIALGCDEPAVVAPPELLKTPPSEPEPTTRPTTQALLEGPRRQIALASMPLTARVPAGWSVKHVDGTSVTFLEGPTPSGEASIQLTERAATPKDKLQILIDGAKKEQQQMPESIKLAELREIPGARVLERQRVGRAPSPALSEPGVKDSPSFNWTISVFIPRGDNYETCELNFIGLTVDQYEADKALLRGIVNSVAVNDAGSTTTTPAASVAR